MYPPAYNIPGVADSGRWIGIRKASQGGMKLLACKQFLGILQVAGIVLLGEEIVSNSLINLQDMWVKDFILIALACK